MNTLFLGFARGKFDGGVKYVDELSEQYACDAIE